MGFLTDEEVLEDYGVGKVDELEYDYEVILQVDEIDKVYEILNEVEEEVLHVDRQVDLKKKSFSHLFVSQVLEPPKRTA